MYADSPAIISVGLTQACLNYAQCISTCTCIQTPLPLSVWGSLRLASIMHKWYSAYLHVHVYRHLRHYQCGARSGLPQLCTNGTVQYNQDLHTGPGKLQPQ